MVPRFQIQPINNEHVCVFFGETRCWTDMPERVKPRGERLTGYMTALGNLGQAFGSCEP